MTAVEAMNATAIAVVSVVPVAALAVAAVVGATKHSVQWHSRQAAPFNRCEITTPQYGIVLIT